MQIEVIDVGSGGDSAVDRMVVSGVQGVKFIMVNTDKQVLFRSKAVQKIQIGDKITYGEGVGPKPEIGQESGEGNREAIAAVLRGGDMVLITAGMSGGMGTGAAPIVAETARDMGILTIGIVTESFSFEGKRRMEQTENEISALREHADSLAVTPNERLELVSEQRITPLNALTIMDDVLRRGVQSISDLIKPPGLVNLDFVDICAVMKDAGYAHMDVGYSSGKEKTQLAASMAISGPLFETPISGTKGVIISITSSPDIGPDETETVASMIQERAHEEANITRGTTFNESVGDEMSVTVIITSPVMHDDIPTQSVSLAAAKTGVSAPGNSARPQQGCVEKTTGFDEDDTSTDIMSIFNR